MDLNRTTSVIVDACMRQHKILNVDVKKFGNTTVLDFGIDTRGGINAGIRLTEICMGALGSARIVAGHIGGGLVSSIQVQTDHPSIACLASQYAGWPIAAGKFFGMGSGPVRLIRGKEELFNSLDVNRESDCAVCVIETRQHVDNDVIQWMREDGNLGDRELLICVAPTASIAGTIQIVGRSIETTMHKLHYLGYDISKVVSGFGRAPLPPIHHKDLTSIGWTNDSILYGADVQIWVHDEDEEISAVIQKIPSCASRDYGKPFYEIFEHYQRDFYAIDPLLFSPAKVTVVNIKTGTQFSAGELRADILESSFGF